VQEQQDWQQHAKSAASSITKHRCLEQVVLLSLDIIFYRGTPTARMEGEKLGGKVSFLYLLM